MVVEHWVGRGHYLWFPERHSGDNLHVAPSPEGNISENCGGSSLVKTAEILFVALVTKTIRVLGGKSCWGLLVLPFCLWEELIAKGSFFVTDFGILALRAAVDLGFWDKMHLELL